MTPKPTGRPSERRALLAVVAAALLGAAAIMTIMLAQSIIAFATGYALALALTAALGVVMLRSSDRNR